MHNPPTADLKHHVSFWSLPEPVRSPITERPSRSGRSVPHPGMETHQAGNSSPGGLGPTRDQDRGHVAQVTGKCAGESDPRRRQCEPTWVLVLPLNPNSF
ncbi:unnamed protein product [Boreogadus saida]